MKVQIYQVDADKEVPYIFQSYERAQKIGIQKDDYNLVAEFEYPHLESDKDIPAILEDIYTKGNDGTLQQTLHKPMRSISMSDIIKVNDHSYYVDTFGFEEINF